MSVIRHTSHLNCLGDEPLRSRLFLHRADAFNEKVDEKPNPKRNLATECVKRMHRQSVHRQIGKHDDQAACGEVISYRGAEQINDAGTVKRREAKRIAAIGVQRAVGNERGAVVPRPRIGAAGKKIAQTGVALQFVDGPGCSVCRAM